MISRTATISPAGDRASDAAAPDYRPTIEDLSLGRARAWLTPYSIIPAILAFVAHALLAQPFYTLLTRACCATIAATAVLLVARYVAVRPPRLPWLEAVYIVHYSQFGLAVTVDPFPVGMLSTIPSPESHERAAVIALLAGYTFILGFAALTTALKGRWKTNPFLPRLLPETVVAANRFYVPVAAAYVIVVSIDLGARTSFVSIANFTDGLFAQGPLITVAAVAYLTRPRVETRLLLLVAAATIAVGVAATSALNNIVLPFAGLAVLWWRAREKVPVLVIAAALGAMLVLQPVKSYFRDIQWAHHADMSIVDAWEKAFLDAEADSASGFTGKRSGGEATRQRLSELTSMAYVVDVVPATVPHAGGEVYEVLAISVVPRLLWPEKPNMTIVGLDKFVIDLGLSDRDLAEHSTTGITLCGQGYYEHGIVGSLSWMALLGAMLACITAYFGTSLAGMVAGPAVLIQWIVGIGGGFINCFGSIWQVMFAGTMLVWLVRWLGSVGRSNERTSLAIERGWP